MPVFANPDLQDLTAWIRQNRSMGKKGIDLKKNDLQKGRNGFGWEKLCYRLLEGRLFWHSQYQSRRYRNELHRKFRSSLTNHCQEIHLMIDWLLCSLSLSFFFFLASPWNTWEQSRWCRKANDCILRHGMSRTISVLDHKNSICGQINVGVLLHSQVRSWLRRRVEKPVSCLPSGIRSRNSKVLRSRKGNVGNRMRARTVRVETGTKANLWPNNRDQQQKKHKTHQFWM